MEAADEHLADRGRLFGRLEDHGIAGDQRRDDVTVRKVRGEIVRSEHGEHAMRLVTHRDLVAERSLHPALRSTFGIRLDRDLDLVDDGSDLGAGFPQRLAGLARNQLGKFALTLAHDIGKAAQRLDAIGVRMRRPLGPGGARGSNFLAGIADLARPDLVAGRRIRRNQSRSRLPSAARHLICYQLAGASCSIASPIRRTALTLLSNGCQSSASAMADQIVSTSSIGIEQGSGSDQ